jgi:hypothetical protein
VHAKRREYQHHLGQRGKSDLQALGAMTRLDAELLAVTFAIAVMVVYAADAMLSIVIRFLP